MLLRQMLKQPVGEAGHGSKLNFEPPCDLYRSRTHTTAVCEEKVVFRFISSSASGKPHSILFRQQSRRNVVPFLFESADEILLCGRPQGLSI